MSEILDIKSMQNDSSSDELFARLKQKAWLRGVPISGLFELTPRCTLNCEMCYVHLSENKISHPELDTRQWLTIMDEACDAGMLFATLTGGECLLYPGFREIYEHLTERGVLVTVFTNGTLLDEEWVSWFSERMPQRIQVSVYGSNPAGYKKVTGSTRAFERVDMAIELLRKYNIPFELAVTVSRNLVEDFEKIFHYCKSKGTRNCMVNSCPFDARPETERKFSEYAPTLDQQVEVFRIQEKVLQEFQHEDNLMKEKPQTQIRENPQISATGILCSAGQNSFSITWEGKMLPCTLFDYAGVYPLQDGFINSWESLHEACLEYVNPVECRNCDYYKACRFCPAGHYLRMGEGHADSSVCSEAYRMVAEGIRFL